MPIVGLISAGLGLYQAISGGVKAHKAEKDLEAQAKGFQPNQSILDYYNKALAKYNPNPYQTASYQQQKNQIGSNLATGLNAAQNRRGGLGAIGGLVNQANQASAQAAGNAENQNRSELSQLGNAAGAKTGEQQKKFDLMYNLTAAKAGAGASQENTGISNLYGGLSNAAYLYGNNPGGGLFGNSGKGDYTTTGQEWRMPRVSRATF
jgi:hypothetical protein